MQGFEIVYLQPVSVKRGTLLTLGWKEVQFRAKMLPFKLSTCFQLWVWGLRGPRWAPDLFLLQVIDSIIVISDGANLTTLYQKVLVELYFTLSI